MERTIVLTDDDYQEPIRSPYFGGAPSAGGSYVVEVMQGSPEWLDLRSRTVGSSEAATVAGENPRQSAAALFEHKRAEMETPRIIGRRAFSTSRPSRSSPKAPGKEIGPMEHGHLWEPRSASLAESWIREEAVTWLERARPPFAKPDAREWAHQTHRYPAGYRVPNPLANRNFSLATDQSAFGASLDYEGSLVDVEIKNPYTMDSYAAYYRDSVMPTVFAQCTWQMAVREREHMLLFITQINKEGDHELRAMAVWLIKFDRVFFAEILARARAFASLLRDGKEYSRETLLRLFPSKVGYARSKEYADVLARSAYRIYERSAKEPSWQKK